MSVIILILKRLAASVVTLFAIVTVSFFLMKAAPGGPFDAEKMPPPAIRKAIEAKYHLDKPTLEQYWLYLKGVAKLDFGPSFRLAGYDVVDVIAAGMWPTLKIGFASMIFAVICGVVLGVVASLYRNGFWDYALMALAMIGISVPSMVLAPVLLLIFGIKLNWLPVSGLTDAKSLILPVVCLGSYYTSNIARLTRGAMLEVLSANYIITAIAKGIPKYKIVIKHALRPCLIPIVSYLGPATAGMLAGSLVIEKIFVIPGVGRQFVDSAFARDYTMALGMILFYCIMVVGFNALVDMMYPVLDPKLRDRAKG